MARQTSSAKRKWDEARVQRDENGRFIAWSMDIQVGNQRVQRSGPDTYSGGRQPARSSGVQTDAYGLRHPAGMSPGHQMMINSKVRWNNQMQRNSQTNRINPGY